MTIALATVTVTGPAELRVTFTEAPVGPEQYDPSHYAISVRYGSQVPCYALSAATYSATAMTVTLRDAMLTGGHYSLTVNGIAGINGVPIESGAGPTTLVFEGAGDPQTVFDIKKRVPQWWNTRRGSRFYGLLYAIGYALDQIMGKAGQIDQVEAGLSIRTATGENLAVIGQNLGIDRPTYLIGDDALYRLLIPAFSTRPKATLQAFTEALTIILGPASTSLWGLYEIRPNELLIELPIDLYLSLVPGTEESATYFHDSDTGASSGVGVGSLTDAAKAWATDRWEDAILVDSALDEFTITGNNATVLTLASGTPAAGHYVILQNSATLFPGDYFTTNYLSLGSSVGDNPVQLFGQLALSDTISRIKAASIEIVIATV